MPRIWFSSDAFTRPSHEWSDELTWKTMNRQVNLGRSYQDYISHFRLHLRDLKPLLFPATRLECPVFSRQNVSELEALGPLVTPLLKRSPNAILDTDKSCPSFFNTRARLSRGPSSWLSSFNGHTGQIRRANAHGDDFSSAALPDFSSGASFISRFHP